MKQKEENNSSAKSRQRAKLQYGETTRPNVFLLNIFNNIDKRLMKKLKKGISKWFSGKGLHALTAGGPFNTCLGKVRPTSHEVRPKPFF